MDFFFFFPEMIFQGYIISKQSKEKQLFCFLTEGFWGMSIWFWTEYTSVIFY